jgi:hypothetical protein
VLIRSYPLIADFYPVAQTLELVSPACALTGEALSPQPISQDEAEQIWSSLGWYLPTALRHQTWRLPPLEREGN